jgi:AcrR family transcriptional regulator
MFRKVPEREGKSTQLQRRAATRLVLLDATVACLLEVGYAGVTVRLVAERAGVSQGALWHHYATKDELIAGAVRHLLDRTASETLAVERQAAGVVEGERLAAMLDRLYELHRGPLFALAMEMLLAARSEPRLEVAWAEVSGRVVEYLIAGAAELLPGFSEEPAFAPLLLHVMSVMRGLAMLEWVPDVDPDQAWALVRPQVLQLFELARQELVQ